MGCRGCFGRVLLSLQRVRGEQEMMVVLLTKEGLEFSAALTCLLATPGSCSLEMELSHQQPHPRIN